MHGRGVPSPSAQARPPKEVAVGAISPMHVILVLSVVPIIYGPGKLPELGAAIGRGIREFRKAADGLEDEIRGDKS